MKYTTEVHIKRLKAMLKYRRNISESCPAGKRYGIGGWGSWHEFFWWSPRWDGCPCDICIGFLGLTTVEMDCPCTQLGEKEAIARTQRRLGEVENGMSD